MTERADRIVAEIPKNSREVIRVAVGDDFRGHSLVNIRSWVQPKNDDSNPPKMIPARHGIAVRREIVPQLIEALRKALAAEVDLG